MIDLCQELMDALEAFDLQTGPLGLYACEEYRAVDQPFPRLHQEWHLCLKPRLEELGCRILRIDLKNGEFKFNLPDGKSVTLGMARTAKIKVRKFGSAYRVDPQRDFRQRWEELRMDRAIRRLQRSDWDRLELFLLLAFAREAEPYEQELSELYAQLAWARYGVHYNTRSWEDRYNRRFFVRLCCWSRSPQVEQS